MARILVGLVLFLAFPASAVDYIGTTPSFTWTASTPGNTGPVAGYEVYKAIGTGPWVKLPDVTTNQATLSCTIGETFKVRVLAFTAGKAQTSGFSPDSEPVTCVASTPPSNPGKPTLAQIIAALLHWFGRLIGV